LFDDTAQKPPQNARVGAFAFGIYLFGGMGKKPQIERDLIPQRTKEALRAKKARGEKLGRPKGSGKSKLDAYRPEIEALLSNGSSQRFIAQRYRTTEANLSRWLKRHGLSRAQRAAARRE